MMNPAPVPVLDAAVVVALKKSVKEIRPLVGMLHRKKQDTAGLVLGQVNLILSRIEQGIAATEGHFLGVLQAAERLQGGTEK